MYGDTQYESYLVDDRTLAHLELAIASELRLGRSFALVLQGDQVPSGRGWHALWLHPAIPIQFKYQHDRRDMAINPRWVAAMAAGAAGEQGVRIVPEPDPPGLGAPLHG